MIGKNQPRRMAVARPVWAAAAAVGMVLAWAAASEAEKPPADYPTLGSIERKDPRFDRLVPADARIERLADGFAWAEGPVWVRKGKYLLFSDIPNNAVLAWQEGRGVRRFLHPSGYTGPGDYGREPGSNGLLLDREGRLILCQHGDRRITRIEPDGRWTTRVSHYGGKRLNSPNDAVLKSNGDLYFTDPPYGLPQGWDDPRRELDFCGVYRLRPDGTLTLLTREMTRPNGIAFSPDEKTLYVAQSDPKQARWMAFPVRDDGTLGPGRVFFDVTDWVDKKKGLPDGMKVDVAGNLFACGPGGVHVFSPDGTLLGTFATGQATANCGWGDDGRTLYITADMVLCRVRLTTKGTGF